MNLKDHLNKIEYFCLVAEAGSLKKASAKALVGQPQLTKVIAQLEDCLDTTLFVRSPKGVSLTRQGSLLLKYCKEILRKTDEAEFVIKSDQETIEGEIRVGTYDSISRYFFPEFLKYMKAVAPRLRIYLETDRSWGVVQKIKKQELDLGVVVVPTLPSKKLNKIPIYRDQFGLYRSPTIQDDFKDTLIYFPYPQNETESAIRRFRFMNQIKCANLETVRSMAEQGVGVGLLPHLVAKESLLGKRLSPYRHPKIKGLSFDEHEISLVYGGQGADNTTLFIVEEIKRFLETWTNR